MLRFVARFTCPATPLPRVCTSLRARGLTLLLGDAVETGGSSPRYSVVTPRFVQVRTPIDAVDLHSGRCTASTVRRAADIPPTEDATHHRATDVPRCATRTPTRVAATHLVFGDEDDVYEGDGSWERLGDVGWEGLGDTGWHTEVPTWTPDA